jgi:hypothetical protein
MNWISVKNRMPEEGIRILLLTDTGIIEGSMAEPDGSRWNYLTLDAHGCGCCAGGTDEVLYWSELPSLPENYKKVQSHL